MSDKHTIATFADGTVVRRHRDEYWTTEPVCEGDADYPGQLDDGERWLRGAVINADEDDGYWTPEGLLAVVCDVLRIRLPEDDESDEADRWARLCDVLDEMQREKQA